MKQRLSLAVKRAILIAAGARRRLHRWSWRTVPLAWRRHVDIVDHYDVWAYRAELTQSVSELLSSHQIEHLILDERLLLNPVIVVDAAQRGAVGRALASDPASATWWSSPSIDSYVGTPRPAHRFLPRPLRSASGILICRNLRSPSGLPLNDSETGVLVQFWTRRDAESVSTGGGRHAAGTRFAPDNNGVLAYAEPALWQSAQQDGHRLPPTPPHLLLVHEPVDVVYTWVNGNDRAWQRRKAAALGDDLSTYTDDAAIDARFESHDELRYSLRSIEMFANWVNHIWIVTDQQVPAWLRQDDRLTVVDHRDIFADPSALPVYNSHAIESQLHHIPGLADRYLYFNDDMLLGAPTAPEAFFHGNQLHRFFPSPALIDTSEHLDEDIAVTAAAKNNRDFLQAQFNRTITNKLRHTPQPQSKPVLDEFEARFPDLFDHVMRSRLREASNYSLPSSLSQYYAFVTGRAVPSDLASGYVDLASAHAEFLLHLWLQRRDRTVMCINDSGTQNVRTSRFLHRFFDNYYPLPSRWEVPASASPTSS